ncbi:MAG: hypothetical protein OEW89_05085 [Gammaproteobacteria bacterium]|nr:hypothetical protein [Gammaproteobacteria bacterium]MDH5592978.1 hypothetical protein [Gammaproteobacteria bacterium]
MSKIVGYKSIITVMVFVGGLLWSLATYAFQIGERNIICQSETETSTETTTDESVDKPKKKKKKKSTDGSGESNPEEDCD